MSSPPSLVIRAFLAITLMIGFYALAISIAGVLLYVPYAEAVYAHRIHIKLVLFCVVGAGIILWSIAPRPDRFVPPGPRLETNQHPRLFSELTGVARAVGQPMPGEVYLVHEVNAWVAQRGGVMGLGSRRVMGLGLPLLQVLTISQLRAVVAHEFGHYHGGDTRLGPWVYKTRAAIGRTLQNLAQQKSILLYPFLWYGEIFLRVTHAISRRQELTADELASRTVGSQPLIDGLQAIHGAAIAYAPYWASEVTAVLNAGFRPPLAEGFARFVNSGWIAQTIAESVDTELKEGKPDPYDTHPPLRDRIAAVQNLPKGEQPAPDPPAMSLLENVLETEARLLAAVADESKVRALKPVNWENVGTEVLIPRWENFVRTYASALAGVTVVSLHEITKDLGALGRKMGFSAGTLPSAEEQVQLTTGLLGAALAVALRQHGWVLHSLPGELYLQRDDFKVEPFTVVRQLATDELKPEAWRELCSAAGISDLNLGQVGIGEGKG